jgi:signal transduction histidine kinase
MLPKSVLHKRNGHRHLPRPGALSAGQIAGLVHSDPGRLSDLSQDLVRFAAIVQSEHPGAQGQSLPSALAKALKRTRKAFERGELSDVRLALEALQAQVEAAVRIVARLTEAAGASDGEPTWDTECRLVNLNDLIIQTVGRLAGQPAGTTSVSGRLDPGLPRIAGDPRRLQHVLMVLIAAVGRAMGAAGRPGVITVETSHGEGVLRGERVVRLLMTDDYSKVLEQVRPVPVLPFARSEPSDAGADADLRRAARLVREHGGVLCAASFAGGGVCFTLDLPAV